MLILTKLLYYYNIVTNLSTMAEVEECGDQGVFPTYSSYFLI